jgi:hypothetical protein
MKIVSIGEIMEQHTLLTAHLHYSNYRSKLARFKEQKKIFRFEKIPSLERFMP